MKRIAGRTFVKVFLVLGAVMALGLITIVLIRLPEIRERTSSRATPSSTPAPSPAEKSSDASSPR